jgi:hypothetical protein
MRAFSLTVVTVAASLGCSSSDESPVVGDTAGSASSTQEGGGAGVSSPSSSGQGGSSSEMSSAGGASTGGMTGTAGQLVSDAAVSGAGGASNDSGGSVIDATPFDGNVPNAIPPGYNGTPLGGVAQIIPGKIEVERYDLGGPGIAFQDNVGPKAFNKCGFVRSDAVELDCTDTRDKNAQGCAAETPGEVYLGYIGAGEWYRYTVVVTEAGRYVISGHEGVAVNNAQVSFSFTQDTKTGALTLPSTVGCNGWEAYHVWGTGGALGQIDLVPGKYVVTLTMVSAGMNLDWFAFKKT